MEKTGGGYETCRPRHSVLQSAARATMVAGVLAVAGTAATGCLTRKVDGSDPTTKVTFNSVVQQTGVDKIDMLFAIDNSRSMGDKEAYLAEAIPDLIARLVTPYCVNLDGSVIPGVLADPTTGKCANGQPEFPPVHDMHIGIVSSSLGERGGSGECQEQQVTLGSAVVDAHMNDKGWLINRTGVRGDGTGVPDAGTFNLLAWFPTKAQANQGKTVSPANAKPIEVAGDLKGAPGLEPDLSSLVTGVSSYGCGIESQLESWYRFLIQPDPYANIITPNNRATWDGVDTTILKQRKDFLRPDSLVAIINLTDENDSEIDVRVAGQTGHAFLTKTNALPRETEECDEGNTNVNGKMTGLTNPSCTSCALIDSTRAANDRNCKQGRYQAPTTPVTDWALDPNLVHVHMKAKYGFDPQFPISRYVNGLTQKNVPNRDGEYPPGAYTYVGNNNCTNPLFAETLPDGSDTNPDTLCHPKIGTARSANQLFYAIIGGVPHQLLPTPGTSGAIDWEKILGRDPENFDYTGIDSHMIESKDPRPGLPAPSTATSTNLIGSDEIHGREWKTLAAGGGADGTDNGHVLPIDLQYACTFDLPPSKQRDCTLPENAPSCDCPTDPNKYSLTPDEVPPLCAFPAGSTKAPTQQVKAKAYPTIRELLLAKKLNDQGIVSSICPIEVNDTNSPVYGYRPAVNSIVDRLKSALAGKCLPQPLEVAADGTVPCLILELLPDGDQGTACNVPGLSQPDAATLSRYRQQPRDKGVKDGDPDLARPLCVVNELTGKQLDNKGSCESSADPGWCYETRDASSDKRCAQSIKFSQSGTPKTGTVISLQCIETAPGTGKDAGGAAVGDGG